MIKLYHGTNYDNALKIMESREFIARHNDFHWLGNGVYFYLDKKLATWWTTQPTVKFGVKINTPALISLEFDKEKYKILDLRFLSDYELCVKKYVEFREKMVDLYAGHTFDYHQFRCSFFDYMRQVYEYDGIIGNFKLPDQPYMNDVSNDLLIEQDIAYTEVQICLSEKVVKELFNDNAEVIRI